MKTFTTALLLATILPAATEARLQALANGIGSLLKRTKTARPASRIS